VLDNFIALSCQANISDITVDIPHKVHTSLIGPKGHLIREIMDECGGVQIRFPSENSNSDKVHIRGPKAEVEKAKNRLQDLANDRVIITSFFQNAIMQILQTVE
jgi:KH domain